jgi:hypothetical protein
MVAVLRPITGFAAEASASDYAAIRCRGPTLVRCTQLRVESLTELSRQLRQLATPRPDTHPGSADNQQLARLNQWLQTAAERADALAKSGAAAGSQQRTGNSSQDLMGATQQMQQLQMSFNLQYLQLQESLQNESRVFAATSNVMKSRQDTRTACAHSSDMLK